MPLQYLSDSVGNHTAVLIPIGEWNLLANKYKELKQLEKTNVDFESKSGTSKMASNETGIEQQAHPNGAARFRGIFTKEEGAKFNQHIDQARKEWDRSF